MKRIKSLIFSGVMLMAALMVANVSWAVTSQAFDPTMRGIVISSGNSIANGGSGGITDTVPQADGSVHAHVAMNCNILNDDGEIIGSTNFNLTVKMSEFDANGVPQKEEIIKGAYHLELTNSKKGSVTAGELTVVGTAKYAGKGTNGTDLYHCLCRGPVTGEWQGAPVNQITCNCLIEVDPNTGTATCKYCSCILQYV